MKRERAMSSHRIGSAEVSGDGTMDAEHEVQIRMVDALAEAIATGRGEEAVTAVVDQLVEYTSAHFMSEQLLMRLYAYPQYELHQQEHDKLLEHAREIQARGAGNDAGGTLDLAREFRLWLLGHMDSKDRAFANFLEGLSSPGAAGGAMSDRGGEG